MLAGKQTYLLNRLSYTPARFFGVVPKLPKAELTVRTPYRTIFENYNNFTRVYCHTLKGLMAIGNKSIPRVYLLPPGEFSVKNMQAGNDPPLSILS